MITQKRLKELLYYDELTGTFIWRINPGNNILAGTIAGHTDIHGYLILHLDNKQYKGHLLAWLYVYGIWPKDMLDHIDNIKSNNRIENLREATRAQNLHNSKIRKDNKTGYKGIYFEAAKNRYSTHIAYNKVKYRKYFHITTYSTDVLALEAAINWVNSMRKQLHGEFANYG